MIEIPDFCFENKSVEQSLKAESQFSTPIEKASFDDGLFLYFKGAEFPMKVIANPEALHATNIMKAIFIEVFANRPSFKSIESTLSSFNRIGMKVMSPYILKDQYMTVQCRELRSISYNFVFSLTSNAIIAGQFSQIVSHLIEYDNAYRLRFIDIASEASQQALFASPRKEIKRLFDIMCVREVQHKGMVTNKIKRFVSFISLALLYPKVGRAFKYAVWKANFENLTYDNIDAYWAFLREDYDFKGLSKVDRGKLLDDSGFSRPVQEKI